MERWRKISHARRLSADAKIIIALLRKQPQTRSELCKNANINASTFYRVVPLLTEHGVIKETVNGFALWTYVELEKAIEKALDKLKENDDIISLNKIASEVGVNPAEIEQIIYKIAKKQGMEIILHKGEKAIAKKDRGAVLF